jgi:hypothetical protein
MHPHISFITIEVALGPWRSAFVPAPGAQWVGPTFVRDRRQTLQSPTAGRLTRPHRLP